MTTKSTKRYLVANPRNIPEGVPVISYAPDNKDWNEGDEFVKPASMKDDAVKRWVDGGYLVEKK